MRYTLEVQKLLNRANQNHIHPKDAGKLLIEAIQIADANEDVELGYELRADLMEREWGLADRSEFVSLFSWMLNAYDADPENFELEEMMWKYKWVINELYSNPAVPLQQLELVLQDYKRRLEENGYALRSYYSKLLNEAVDQQDTRKSNEYLEKVNALPTDELSDCRACEMDTEVACLINQGDFDAAYTKALPLLQKQYTCAHVPVITFCQLCYMAIKQQKTEKAAELFAQAEEGLHDREEDTSLITSIGALIVYLFKTDKAKGWEYIEKYLSWAATARTSRSFFFSLNMAEALREEDQEKQVNLELAEDHPLYNPSHTYLVKDLYHYYYSEALQQSKDFDERNGNQNFSIQMEKALS